MIVVGELREGRLGSQQMKDPDNQAIASTAATRSPGQLSDAKRQRRSAPEKRALMSSLPRARPHPQWWLSKLTGNLCEHLVDRLSQNAHASEGAQRNYQRNEPVLD